LYFRTYESLFFAVATEKDHVAPWRSVFKFHLLNDAEITFVLANGGHNAGITSDALLVKVKDGKVQSKMPLEDFHKVIAVDLRGVFLCGREAAQNGKSDDQPHERGAAPATGPALLGNFEAHEPCRAPAVRGGPSAGATELGAEL